MTTKEREGLRRSKQFVKIKDTRIFIVRKRRNMLTQIESRFKEVAQIDIDMSVFPLPVTNYGQQAQTNKEKSYTYGEVFTPLWLVDEMILRASEALLQAKTTHDLCAGYGQFTIRMMRFLANNKRNFEVKEWLRGHAFTEYQPDSSYKLLYIFGEDINIYMGDACKLSRLKDDDINNGIYIYNGQWENITKEAKEIFRKVKSINFKGKSETPEDVFVEEYKRLCKDKDKGPRSLFL